MIFSRAISLPERRWLCISVATYSLYLALYLGYRLVNADKFPPERQKRLPSLFILPHATIIREKSA